MMTDLEKIQDRVRRMEMALRAYSQKSAEHERRAVNELLKSFEVPVIFITAYPERFLTGERPEPAFLIAKPFQPATVSAVISQVLFFERKARRPQRRAG